MNKSSYIKYPKDINFLYLPSMVLLFVYGIYKNVFLLFSENIISVVYLFKPLLLIVLPLVFNMYFKRQGKKFNIYWYIILLFIPYEFNVFITLFLFIFLFFLENKLKVKSDIIFPFLFKLLTSLTLFIMGTYTYLNPAEAVYSFKLSILDIFFGRGLGGLFSSSIVYSLVAYITLSFNFYYKKFIPAFSIFLVYSLFLIFALFNYFHFNSFPHAYLMLFCIYFLTYIKIAPYKIKMQIIYIVLFIIISMPLIFFINIYEALFIALLIMALIFKVIDKKRLKAT